MNANMRDDFIGTDRAAISEHMIAVRNRGLLNARDLSQEVERLGDWREHVRAYPVPLVLAAVSLGYWMVPSRPKAPQVHQVVPQASSSVSQSASASTGKSTVDKSARAGGLSGAAFGFIGSLAANAIRSYISEQLHTLIQGDQHHEQQRKASPRFTQRQ